MRRPRLPATSYCIVCTLLTSAVAVALLGHASTFRA